MENVENDIKQARNIILNNTGNDMTEYSKFFQNTTENLKAYLPYLKENYSSALLPTSSGDHQLEAILDGITDITCFDINKLAKYFTELKFAAVKGFTKQEFIRFMYDDVFNKEMYGYICNNLDDNYQFFWNELLNRFNPNTIRHGLFRKVSIENKNGGILTGGWDYAKYSAENFTRYMIDDNYKLVQDKLQGVNIEYLDSNLLDIPLKLNKKYDLINLSNIYEYINKYVFDNSAQEFSEVIKKLINILNDNGKLVMDYYYERGLNDLEKNKNKSIMYAYFLRTLHFSHGILASIYNNIGNRNALSKLNDIREFQYLRYLDDIDIDVFEFERSRVSCRYFMDANTDMILFHHKKPLVKTIETSK